MKRLDSDGRDVTDLPGLWGDEDRIFLTPDGAKSYLPNRKYFRVCLALKEGRLAGADWSREVLCEMFDTADMIFKVDFFREEEGCSLAFVKNGNWWFIPVVHRTAAPPQLGSPGGAEVANVNS